MLTFRPRSAWAGLCGCPLKQAVQAAERRTVETVKHEVGLAWAWGKSGVVEIVAGSRAKGCGSQ